METCLANPADQSMNMWKGIASSSITDSRISSGRSKDAQLLKRWRAGDAKSGAQLCRSHWKDIRRFFENKVGRDVDDLVQATFLACLQSRDKFRGECSFRTFLFTIARHQLYSHFRHNRREDNIDFSEDPISAWDTGLMTHTERRQEYECLVRALQKLSCDQRLLIELHYWEGIKLTELAGVFEVSKPTMRTRLHRARRALRTLLTKEGVRVEP